MIPIPIIFLLCVLFLVFGGFILFLIVELIRHVSPYRLFKLHAFLTTHGIYRVKRKDDAFDVKSGFVETTVTEYSWDKDVIRFRVESGFETFFTVNYDVHQQKIKNFDCSSSFAKGVNNDNFLRLLQSYIPYVLEREFGKKSDRVMALEKMKSLSDSFQPKKEKQKEKQTSYQLVVPQTTSFEITELVRKVNALSVQLQQNKQELELEAQHDFETLLSKRVPNVLKHVTQHEKEVKEMLQDVLHKLNEWQTSIEESATNDVEKELLLIKKITQR